LGVKVTLTVVLAPAATLTGNVLGVKLKSAAFVPPSVAPETVNAALPVLFTVTTIVLGVFTGTEPKSTVAVDRLTVGAGVGPGEGALVLLPPHEMRATNSMDTTTTVNSREKLNFIWDLGQPGGGGRFGVPTTMISGTALP
jgi:hypothetical protein